MIEGVVRSVAPYFKCFKLTPNCLSPDQPETIIIDEPELGLHPTAINKLAALVRNASLKKQIILATQSVNLVNCFTPEDILVVNRTNQQTTFDRLNTEELSTWINEYNIGDIWKKNVIGGQP